MNVKVEPIKPAIGAVVHCDKATLLGDDFAKRCLDLLEKHVALVFPRIAITDQEQLRFTDKLGERVNFASRVPGGDFTTKDVYTITLDPEVNSDSQYVPG